MSADTSLEARVAAGAVTLGDVTHLAARVEALNLEVATHKARAAGAERSRDAHARALIASTEALPWVRDYCDRLAKHHADKALELDAKAGTDGELELDDALDRRAHLGASSTAESIGLKIGALLTAREAEGAVGG